MAQSPEPAGEGASPEPYSRWSPPLEHFVERQIPPAQALHFMKGCRTVFDIVRMVEPDVLFVPERGATPVSAALDTFMEETSRHYDSVFLPIGTKTDPSTGYESGFNIPEKRELIAMELDRLHERRQASGVSSAISAPLLIDEVQSGGTIKHATYILQNQLRERFDCEEITITAMQDSRVPHLKKAKGFGTMLANEKKGVTAFSVNLPQIFMDRSQLLSALLLEPDAPLDKLRVVPNLRTNRFIGALAVGLSRPDHFFDAIRQATASDPPSPLAEDWVVEYQRLCVHAKAAKESQGMGRAAVSFFSYRADPA